MKRSTMIIVLGVACLLLSSEARATPILTPHLGATLQLNMGSVYNPRISGGYNYATNLDVDGLLWAVEGRLQYARVYDGRSRGH